jgi:hypothetical protein
MTLPAPVQGYVDASNAINLDALVEWFADDAFVNDARREFWGKDAIRAWLDREVIGDKVTMDVTAASEHHGQVTVAGAMDGDYDKTGLPDPLILTHYFTVRDDRIVTLIVIRNEPTPAWARTEPEQLVRRYFELAPRADTDAYFAQFTDDAVVVDEDRAHRGIAAIRAWRGSVPRVSYAVRDVTATTTGYHADVEVAGDFPGSPVRLTFGFQFGDDGRVTALTITP